MDRPDDDRLLALLHLVARESAAVVRHVDLATDRSFRVVAADHRHEPTTWILMHNVLPIVTATDRDPAEIVEIGKHLVDWEPLSSKQVADVGWVLLDAATASEHLRPADLVDLSEGELHQVRYWKPRTIGELMFNHWD